MKLRIRSMRRIALFASLALGISLLIAFGFSTTMTPTAPASGFGALEGSIKKYETIADTPPAPDVEFTTASGETMTLADFKGKTVLLNLWATWCPPCIREMPDLNELAGELKDKNFVVVAIATGRQGREDPDEFLQSRGLTDILSYHDKKQNFLKAMKVNTLPVTYIIAPNGTLQGEIKGITHWTSDEAKAAFETVLTQQ
ncbi:TlpA disulfide reductase family protein [Terasakiella sp. A23]|uniref:TlpA disulfide reductase family protein n=1 Tax=Terasakiella sp. FCG-A23 TaxID=3080561 RepID=UPI002954D3F5|nr:TlpA disulfide reductase family protein [Terasakiella sp. A23]MDV7340383.1 TlpA disulfide reductase family protein [Terasakiella sp. A23]